MAIKIIFYMLGKQKERGSPVCGSFEVAIQTYAEIFTQYGYRHVTNSVPEMQPGGSSTERRATDEIKATAGVSSS